MMIFPTRRNSNLFRSLAWHRKKTRFFFEFLVRTGSVFAMLIFWGGALGCATDNQYREEHVIKDLKVVFVDQQTLYEEWQGHTGKSGVKFMPYHDGGIPLVKTLRGFYDFSTNTLYCPKWNFTVCGHELHHAALGHFHAKE